MKLSFNLHKSPNYRLGLLSLNYIYEYEGDSDASTVKYLDTTNKIIKLPIHLIYEEDEYLEQYNKFYGVIQFVSGWEDELIYGDVRVENNVLVLSYQIYDTEQYTIYKSCEYNENVFKESLFIKPTQYTLSDRAKIEYIYNANLMDIKTTDSECLHANPNDTSFSVADRIGLDERNIKNTLVHLIDYDLYEEPKWTNWIANVPFYEGRKIVINTTDYLEFKNEYFKHYLRYGSGHIGIPQTYQNMVASREFNVYTSLRGVADYERPNIYGVPGKKIFKYVYDTKPSDDMIEPDEHYLRYWFLDLRQNKNALRDTNNKGLYVEPGFFIGNEILREDYKPKDYLDFYFQNGNILTPWHSNIDDYKTYVYKNDNLGIDETIEFFESIKVPHQGQGEISTSLDYLNNTIDKFGNAISFGVNTALAVATHNPFAATRATSGGINLIKGFANWNNDIKDKLGKNTVPLQDNKIYKLSITYCDCYSNKLELELFKPKYIQNINKVVGFTSPILEVIYD